MEEVVTQTHEGLALVLTGDGVLGHGLEAAITVGGRLWLTSADLMRPHAVPVQDVEAGVA